MTVTVANRQKVQSTHDGALDVPGLPPRSGYAHVIPGIKHSLLSILRMCKVGGEGVFGIWGLNVEVRYRGNVILTGRKVTINGLWYAPITMSSEDNPDQASKSEDNPEQQVQETVNHATQQQFKCQSPDAQEFSTPVYSWIGCQLEDGIPLGRRHN